MLPSGSGRVQSGCGKFSLTCLMTARNSGAYPSSLTAYIHRPVLRTWVRPLARKSLSIGGEFHDEYPGDYPSARGLVRLPYSPHSLHKDVPVTSDGTCQAREFPTYERFE